ncbi:MAG: hypothetical protein AAGA50_09360 [Pseudomonadota bacterium]
MWINDSVLGERPLKLTLFGHPKDDILVATTAKSGEVPVHLRIDTPKPRGFHPHDQTKKFFPSQDFH